MSDVNTSQEIHSLLFNVIRNCTSTLYLYLHFVLLCIFCVYLFLCIDTKMSELNEGFDIEKYENTDYTEYASALEDENLSSTYCDMESESIWTPARRHKKKEGLWFSFKPGLV